MDIPLPQQQLNQCLKHHFRGSMQATIRPRALILTKTHRPSYCLLCLCSCKTCAFSSFKIVTVIFIVQNFIRKCLAYRKEERPDVLVLANEDYLKANALKST